MNAAEQGQTFKVVYDRRAVIAEAWYNAIAYTSFTPLTAQEVQSVVLDLTTQAITLLFADRFEAEAARSIGATLPQLNLRSPESLSRTVDTLASQMIRDVQPEAVVALQPRLAVLLGEIAAGFFRQAREVILADQEEIRDALLIERHRAATVLAEARDQALEAARLKSDFLATMSHELRTPLNSIIGFTDLTLEQHAGPLNDQQRNNLLRVSRNARTLLELINSVLDMSKIDAGHMQLDNEPVSIRNIVESALADIGTLVQAKQLQSTIMQPQSALPHVRGDAVRLHQVVLNLLSNAVKFTPAEGTITLVLEHGLAEDLTSAAPPVEQFSPGPWVAVSVQDTGIGIPSEEHARIWGEFYQIDSSPTRQYSGTGLGLTIAKRLTMLMGGYIGVRSVVGSGSTFTLWLPIMEPSQAASNGNPYALSIESNRAE